VTGRGDLTSGVLVHIVHELPGLGRGEVDVPGGAVPASDADREPAGAKAESGAGPRPARSVSWTE
jgi:hypothetical protein